MARPDAARHGGDSGHEPPLFAGKNARATPACTQAMRPKQAHIRMDTHESHAIVVH
jgi:hypothetical protein